MPLDPPGSPGAVVSAFFAPGMAPVMSRGCPWALFAPCPQGSSPALGGVKQLALLNVVDTATCSTTPETSSRAEHRHVRTALLRCSCPKLLAVEISTFCDLLLPVTQPWKQVGTRFKFCCIHLPPLYNICEVHPPATLESVQN